MQIVRTYSVPYAPAVSPSYFRSAILPNMADCPRADISPFINSLGDEWNCNRCAGEKAYFQLFKRGDIIPIQVALADLRNTNIMTPAAGWLQTGGAPFYYIKAELYDCTGTTRLFEFVDEFCSDWWVDYSRKIGSYQVLFIDTALLPLLQDSFRIKITNYDLALNPVTTIWSEPYAQVSCEQTIEISAVYSTVDCLPHEYRQNVPLHQPTAPVGYVPTRFYLWARIEAQFWQEAYRREAQTNDLDRVLRQTQVKEYELQAHPVPPYMAEIIAALIGGETVFVNGVEYTNWGEIARNAEAGRMFWIDTTAQKRCDINSTICD